MCSSSLILPLILPHVIADQHHLLVEPSTAFEGLSADTATPPAITAFDALNSAAQSARNGYA